MISLFSRLHNAVGVRLIFGLAVALQAFHTLYSVRSQLGVQIVVQDDTWLPALATKKEEITNWLEKQLTPYSGEDGRLAAVAGYNKLDAPSTFSACLYFKDDNRKLPEWLAYHYTTAPLRRLIISQDPLAITSPEPILDAYREIGMEITLWHESDFFQKGQGEKLANVSIEEKFAAHQVRQRRFISACTTQLRSENATWTMLVDTDEFVTLNRYQGEAAQEGKPSSEASIEVRKKLPIVGQPNSTLAHVIAGRTNADNKLFQNWGCITLPRIFFGPHSSTEEEIQSQVPDGFNPRFFYTLNHRKHAPWKRNKSTLGGKSIVDLSRNQDKFLNRVHIAYNPDHKLCNTNVYPNFADSIFRVHHYTGTEEDFMSKSGELKRSSRERFQQRISWRPGAEEGDDDTRGWLARFVELVGKRKAWFLTECLRAWAVENDKLLFPTTAR